MVATVATPFCSMAGLTTGQDRRGPQYPSPRTQDAERFFPGDQDLGGLGKRRARPMGGRLRLHSLERKGATAHAARDQFGRRALGDHETPDRLIIASAPKGIFAVGDVPREIDEQKLADALGQLYYDASRSYFKDIRRLPPAHLLIADETTTATRRYWSLENVPDVRFASDDDYVEAAREHLARAVKAHLRSAGPVGAFMSGGLDFLLCCGDGAAISQGRGEEPAGIYLGALRRVGRSLQGQHLWRRDTLRQSHRRT